MSFLSGLDWGLLALKAGITAAIVVAASLIAERSRPFVAAIILSLPVSAGPAYVLLALQHDADFVAAASLASLPVQIATALLVIAYVGLARRGAGSALSALAATGAWGLAALILTTLSLDFQTSLILVVLAYAVLLPLTWGWRRTERGAGSVRRWYDVPVRALLVAVMVIGVVTLSSAIGPRATGTLAAFPVTYSSFMVLMHRRLGGAVLAAAMIHGLFMLIGFMAGLAGLHLLARGHAVSLGLAALFVVPVVWSLGVIAWTKWGRARLSPPPSPALGRAEP